VVHPPTEPRALIIPCSRRPWSGPDSSNGTPHAKTTKKYDKPATPAQRASRDETVTAENKKAIADGYPTLNPAAIQRKIQALTAQLLTLTTAKARANPQPPVTTPAARTSTSEQATPATRAS
jgi:hypothetical protein